MKLLAVIILLFILLGGKASMSSTTDYSVSGGLPTATNDPSLQTGMTPLYIQGDYGSPIQIGGPPAPDPATVYNNGLITQLQGQLGNLDPQQAIGLRNIGSSYNLAANRLDESNAVAKRNYTTANNQNTQGYSNNRNNIITNTRNTANALQRLLGINGAGNSSAAYEQAPYAAGLQGTQQLNTAQQTYGTNAANIDTNWQDAQRQYSHSLEDLNTQKYQQENNLRSSIAQTKAGILGQIGQISGSPDKYAGDIQGLLDQITQLSNQYANPVVRTSDVNYAAPNLNDYILKSNASAPVASGGAASDLAPQFLSLLSGQRDQYGNLIQA